MPSLCQLHHPRLLANYFCTTCLSQTYFLLENIAMLENLLHYGHSMRFVFWNLDWCVNLGKVFIFKLKFPLPQKFKLSAIFGKIDFWTLTEWMKTKLISIVNNEWACIIIEKRESNIPSGFVTESLYFSSIPHKYFKIIQNQSGQLQQCGNLFVI